MPKLAPSLREEYIAKLTLDYPNLPRIAAEHMLDTYEVSAEWMIKTAKEGQRRDRLEAKLAAKSNTRDVVVPGDVPAPDAPQAHA